MGFLETAELADIRADFEATFPTTCTITAVTRTASGSGGWSESESNRGTAIACRLAPVTARSFPGLTAEQVQEGRLMMLYLAHDQTVEVTDKVTHGGVTYHVRQLNDGESELFMKTALLEVRE